MCGFAGEFRFDGSPADAAPSSGWRRCLEPRGPDGWGLVAHGALALGHRRLNIIDLSEPARSRWSTPSSA